MSDVNDVYQSKIRLAQELLALLKAERNAPFLKPKSAGPSLDDFEMTETVAQGHQKRDNKRFTYPVLRVLIGTQTYNTTDWSLGGLMVSDYDGDIKQHGRFKLAMSDGSKNATYFAAEGRATRVDRKKRLLGVQFTSLSKGGFEWLSGLQLLQRTKEIKVKAR
ncbi:MAG: PilZ domain-containing protein [Elsteraceae bacterium]